ncbi:MAG: T9SS type A sorting domain-containing protein [Crocinitomicaceae bacterium]|nr:T9SS type A sorting domain-containing protein [Crocinitomicaceae bacterium]
MKRYTLILAAFSAWGVNAQIDFELITPPPPAPQITHNIAPYQNPGAAVGDFNGNGSMDLIIFGNKPGDDFHCGLHFNDGNGSFIEDTNHSITGVRSRKGGVAVGDIDGDGDLDFIVAGQIVGFLPYTGLFTNDGNGNFSEVTSTGLPDLNFAAFDFADVDGDGDLDLLITGREGVGPFTFLTQLYLNDGNGNFTLDNSNSFTAVSRATVNFADLNGNNSPDLIVTGSDSNGESITSIYINDGNGNFTEDTTHPLTDIELSSVVIFDADGDGDLDIVISGSNSQSSVAITELYLNDGNGTFTENTNSSFEALRIGDISAADVDGDGDIDFILTGQYFGSSADTTVLYLNDGNGLFVEAINNSFTKFRRNVTLLFDIDNDGDDDLFLSGDINNGNDEISQFYINDGAGNFELLLIDMLQPGTEAAFADVNGDGFLDMLVAGSTTKLYLNDGNGFYEEVAGTPFVPLSNPALAFADVDGDGDMDVMLQGFNMQLFPTTTILYLNDGNGNFTEDTNNLFTQLYDDGSVTFGDADGDGDIDLIHSGRDSNNDYITVYYTNDGNGNFTVNTSANLMNIYGGEVIMEDLNNNGSLDLIISGLDADNSYIATTKVYFNDGTGNFTEDTQNQISGHYLGGIDLGDINGDGNLDLVITGYDESNEPMTKLYTNDGAGQFTEVTPNPLIQLFESRVAFSDVDLDGDLDLLIHGADINFVSHTLLYENDGTGVFTAVTGMPFDNSGYGALVFADIDNDGDEDVLLAGLKGLYGELEFARVYRNLAINCSPIDITTTLSGATITANNTNATYQWIDCDDNNAPITGATNQSFTATANGNYAVEITENDCTATSDCIAVTTVGLSENELAANITLYPNPSNDIVTIDGLKDFSSVTIHDALGKLIRTYNLDAANTLSVNVNGFEGGMYFVKINNEQTTVTKRLMVTK